MDTGWTGGYCTVECDLNCWDGSACLVLGETGAEMAYCLANCTTEKDCRPGYLCNPWQGVCLPDCRNGYHCGSQQCSDNGYCVSQPPITPEGLGGHCRTALECTTSYCLVQHNTTTGVSWTDGMCSALCGSCAPGSYCTTLGEASFCLPDCTQVADCRDGYICHPQIRTCFPDCRVGFDCGGGYACDPASGACSPTAAEDAGLPIPSKDTSPLGSPCRDGTDCDSDLCFPQEDSDMGFAWKSGICTQPCGTCAAGFDCIPLGENAYCVRQCTQAVDCREGYVCNEGLHVCLPDCRLGYDCGDYRCDTKGDCVPSTAGPSSRAPPPLR